MTYDDSNRVASMDFDGEGIEYGYADTEQLESVTGGDANLAMTWDGPLLLTREQDGVASGAIAYTWEDGTLNLASMDVNGTAVDYTYDTDGMPLTIGQQTLDYQPKTSFVRTREVGDVKTDYTYNDHGELSEMTTRAGGSELLSRVFTYDGLGRIVEVEETNQGTTTTYTYGYDLIGQLVQVEASGDQSFTHTYDYDDNGNRTAVSNGTDDLTAGDIDHDVDDRLMQYGAATFAYNDAGQRAEKTEGAQTTTYDYGVSGELRQVTLPSGQLVEYEHDALQRRVARKVDGAYTHRFLYGDNINPVAEVDENGDTVSTFVYGTGINVPDYMVRGGTTYFIVRDHLGSVRFVVDAGDGSVAQELRYDEFGQVTFDSNPGFQPFGYAGGLYDPKTGLVRFGARDYAARVGRWTASDPIAFGSGQTNLWLYVQNTVMTSKDPLGLAEIGIGIEFRFDAILPTSNGFLGSVGIDLEYTTSEGLDVHAIKPVRQVGLSVGASCQLTGAVGSEGSKWPGYFDAVGGSLGPVVASYFQSPSRPMDVSEGCLSSLCGTRPSMGSTGWRGLSLGLGASPLPAGVSYTRVDYSGGVFANKRDLERASY